MVLRDSFYKIIPCFHPENIAGDTLMFEISDLSLVLVYFKPVLPVALQRRLDTLAYLLQLPLLGLQIAKERLHHVFHDPRQIEDDPV